MKPPVQLTSLTQRASLAVLCALPIGCTGQLAGDVTDGNSAETSSENEWAANDDENGEPDNQAPQNCEVNRPHVSTSVLRRMTRAQYNRTVELLLGDASQPADLFPVDTREEGYDNQSSSQHVQRPQVVAWETAATALAAKAVENVRPVFACDDDEPVDSCVENNLSLVMRRLLRASPEGDEVARYRALYEEFKNEASPRRAAELLIRALLLAPRFLFMVEEGRDWQDGVARLSPYEIAARLAFTLWNQAPDEELLDIADSGALDSKEDIRAQATRMLADPRAADVVLDFHSQWIDLAQVDNMTLPEGAGPGLREAAKAEIEWFLRDWHANSGLVPALFQSRSSLLDESLAELYGVDYDGTPAIETELPADERAGLLTRAVFLGTHEIPPTRGDFVLARVLCSPVPPLTFMPPAPPDLGPAATTREKFERHSEDPCAAGCHGILDPVGFAFEHYDHSGQWRDTENGQPVDSTTVLTLPADTGITGAISGAQELSDKIAESPLTRSCLGQNWFRYAYGRAAKPVDECSVGLLTQELSTHDDVRDLLLALTQTDAFLYIRKEGL